MDKKALLEFAAQYVCNHTNISCLKGIANDFIERYKLNTNNQGLPYIGDGLGERPLTDEHIFYITLWTIVVPILFALITIIGITGNILVIAVIIKTEKLHTSTNKFLVNLAISDIIFLSLCVPFQAYKYAAWSWPFGEIWCKIIQYLLFVTAYVTIWTLVCIAVIRYVILVRRNSRLRVLLHGMCVEICMFLWIIMFFLHIPTYNAHQINNVDIYFYCGMKIQSTEALVLSFFICAYVLPLSLICLFYLLVIYHLNKNELTSDSMRRSFRRRNHCVRVSKIIIVVVLFFTISWLPLHIHMLISIYWEVPQGKFYEVFRIIWHCMAYGNSLANPFIYNYVSVDFRQGFQRMFSKKALLSNGSRYFEDTRPTSYKQSEPSNGMTMVPRSPNSRS